MVGSRLLGRKVMGWKDGKEFIFFLARLGLGTLGNKVYAQSPEMSA